MFITILTTNGFFDEIRESFKDNNYVEIKTIDDYDFPPHTNAEKKLAAIVDQSPNHIYFLHVTDIYGREARTGKINHKCDEGKKIRVYTFSHQQIDPIFNILIYGDINALIEYSESN